MVLYCENIVSDIVLLFLKNIGYCFVFFLKSNIVLGFVLPAQGGKNIVWDIITYKWPDPWWGDKSDPCLSTLSDLNQSGKKRAKILDHGSPKLNWLDLEWHFDE